MALLVVAICTACGAGDADAPLRARQTDCPTLDQAAATWLNDVHAGAYAGTAALLRDQLPGNALRTVLGAALKALGPTGTDLPTQLIALMRSTTGGPWLRLFSALANAAESASADAAALAIRTASGTCTTPVQLLTLANLIDDPRVRSGLADLLGGEPDAVAQAFAALGVTNRKGAQTLLGLILDSAARADFDPTALRGTLADAKPAAGAAAGTLDALIAVLDGATQSLDGELDADRIEASSSLIACVRAADPDDGLLALLTMVLLPPPHIAANLPADASATTAAGDTTANARDDSRLMSDLFDAISALLRVMGSDEAAMVALREIVNVFATVDTLRVVVPEVQHLFASGALPDLADALDQALRASCTVAP